MFKKALWLSVLIMFTTSSSSASDAEFKKWLKQYKKEFQSFVDEHDKEFAQFLKANWVETEVKPEEQRDSAPKIVEVPVAVPEPQPTDNPQPTDKPIPDTSEPDRKPTLPKPIDKPPTPELPPVIVEDKPVKPVLPVNVKSRFSYVKRGQKGVKVKLLGVTLVMPKYQVQQTGVSTINSDALSESWLVMAKTNFKPAVEAISRATKDLQLDDWGQALLTYEYLEQSGRLSKNDKQLYSWFLLVKQGFDSRIAFNNNQVYLMLNVQQRLFGQKYFNLKDGKYYFVDLGQKRPINVGSVYTYNQQHSSANSALEIDLTTAPKHGELNKTRKLKTKINNKEVVVQTRYSADYVEYLDHYPQLNMEHYFRAELPIATKDSLVTQLKPHLRGLSEKQALNLLLNFVQTSLSYQTDQQQFQYENYLFATETLHYPYADCEDRSVLFAYLVKQLLGNDVVGLQYNGHIATAVAVTSEIAGDSYTIDGQSYVVADPTFINAKIGRTMTGFENDKPKFIVF